MFRSQNQSSDQPPLPDDEPIVLIDRAVHPFLVLFHEPEGFRAEQVRGLRNKLVALNPDGASKSLVITSAIRGEGKTVTAINLALALAELDHTSVLLIDGDLRSPSVERYLNLNPDVGFSDLLIGSADLGSVVRECGVRNLSVMGAGKRLTGPSEIISAPKVEELFDRLKERYQYVVVDTPPVLPATDASVIAARADGCLLVVRLEHSSKNLTKQAIKSLRDLGANMLGSFVTEVRGADPDADPRLAHGETGRV